MGSLATYRIGRDQSNDVVIDDNSVSRLHAELVLSKSGKMYLSDCKSNNGTFVGRDGQWVPIIQNFIEPAEVILLGRHQTTGSQLMAMAQASARARAGKSAPPSQSKRSHAEEQRQKNDLPSGKVRRDPGTGDIIKVE